MSNIFPLLILLLVLGNICLFKVLLEIEPIPKHNTYFLNYCKLSGKFFGESQVLVSVVNTVLNTNAGEDRGTSINRFLLRTDQPFTVCLRFQYVKLNPVNIIFRIPGVGARPVLQLGKFELLVLTLCVYIITYARWSQY